MEKKDKKKKKKKRKMKSKEITNKIKMDVDRSRYALGLTWNILHQRYVKQELVDSGLTWEHRLPLINMRLRKENYSYICLQEVDLTTVDESFGNFKKVYHLIPNVQGKRHNSDIGCLTMLSKSHWDVIEVVETSVGVHVLANLTITDQKIWICNVHLKKGYKSGQETRIEQLKAVMGVVALGHLKYKEKHPAVIVGTFNDDFKPGRKITEMLRKNRMYPQSHTPKSYCIGNRYRPFDRAIGWKTEVFYCEWPEFKFVKIPDNYVPSDHIPIEFYIKV